MARLQLTSNTKTQTAIDELYNDLVRRLQSSSNKVCPVDAVSAFLKVASTQSCGKCVPCRVGLKKLEELLDILSNGEGGEEILSLIKSTAESIYASADCAIGYQAADAVIKGLDYYREDFLSHANGNGCLVNNFDAVPCVEGCPAHVDVPGYVALVNQGRCKDAIKLIRKDNPFPLVCGFICEHPCELKCRRGIIDSAINIRAIKRYAVENAGNVEPPKAMDKTDKKVAVIGGGPGGLTCAYYLALMGHSVKIFEGKKQLGGMLRYGIPSYRLPRELLDNEINDLLSTGISVEKGVSVGKDIPLSQIVKEYDAVYIAIGACTDKKLGIEGEDAKGVISAVELLDGIGDGVMPDFTGKRVVVIGGGNVAMDVARSSIRLGAKSVNIVYRRRREDMTAQVEEVNGAVEEGCIMTELKAPVRIEKDGDNNAVALWVKPQIIGSYDRGRPKPFDSALEEERIECDIILVAIGQGIDSKAFEDYGLPVKRGTITALDTTEIQGFSNIFSGGDCVSGPATVIKAIAAGKVAAANIDEYLGYEHKISCDVEIPYEGIFDNKPCGRINTEERTPEERKHDFNLMEIGLDKEKATKESSRCLRCDKYGLGCFKDGRNKQW